MKTISITAALFAASTPALAHHTGLEQVSEIGLMMLIAALGVIALTRAAARRKRAKATKR